MSPPFDRSIALACTLPALRARWLYVRCDCGASHGLSIRPAIEENRGGEGWSLADLVARAVPSVPRQDTHDPPH